MRGREVVHRLVALTLVTAVAVAACQPTTPTVAPTVPSTLLQTAAPTAGPTPAPSTSPVPRPTPTATASGVVPLDVRPISGPLDARFGASGVWTGSEVIIWGGVFNDDFFFGTWRHRRSGAAYNPTIDDWHPIADAPIRGRYGHLAGWTGREMLVWGGSTANWSQGTEPDGAAYNPRTDRWCSIAQSPLRWGQGRTSVMTDTEWVVAIRTKREVLVAAYDPDADSWRMLPSIPREFNDDNRMIWTGADLVLANAVDGMYRLAPEADAWVRSGSRSVGWDVVWTGTDLLAVEASWLGEGLVRYDPVEDAWQEVPGPPLEGGRLIWTGTHALVIADVDAPSYLYNPATGIWLEMSWPKRMDDKDQVSVWTARGLVEWGGWHGGVGGVPTDAGWVLRPDIRRAELFDPSEL